MNNNSFSKHSNRTSKNNDAQGLSTSTESLQRWASDILHQVPGGHFAASQLRRLEQRLLTRFKRRLDQVTPVVAETTEVNLSAEQLSVCMQALLNQSQTQTHAQAESSFFLRILHTLVPDQARILAALSDGVQYPLINVETGTRFGKTFFAVECVSSVGKSAGVQCPELTHIYLQHLRQYGLISIDPIENDQTMRYEILETDVMVRKTLEHLKAQGQRAKILRYSLRISDLGERLWAACQSDDLESKPMSW